MLTHHHWQEGCINLQATIYIICLSSCVIFVIAAVWFKTALNWLLQRQYYSSLLCQSKNINMRTVKERNISIDEQPKQLIGRRFPSLGKRLISLPFLRAYWTLFLEGSWAILRPKQAKHVGKRQLLLKLNRVKISIDIHSWRFLTLYCEVSG